MDGIEKIDFWYQNHRTHTERYLNIIQRQSEIFKGYVELIKSTPVDRPEFYPEILRLHYRLMSIVDEMPEMIDLFKNDLDLFTDALISTKQEMGKNRE